MNKKGVQCFSKAGDSWLSLIAHLAKRKMSHSKEHSQLLSALSKPCQVLLVLHTYVFRQISALLSKNQLVDLL